LWTSYFDINDLNITSSDTIIYLCGKITDKIRHDVIYVIKELSSNYDNLYQVISLGEVPINIHGVGVYFRKLFNLSIQERINLDVNFFDKISFEHKFQSLTESNKVSNAFRKGIYLSKVEKINDETHFNLLRCSTNLDGPTENFCDVDNFVINKTNYLAKQFFDNPAELNHVLAQIYVNKTEIVNGKTTDKKAKISQHSDKTKDMPANGLIAFCTFYDHIKSKQKMFDYCYNDISVLTELHFKLKNTNLSLTKEFSVRLYPNSVFLISLSTNRLYTHEIRPSILPNDKIPIRMGYVIRCSKTKAVFKNGETFIDHVKLEKPDIAGITNLKKLYLEENITDNVINYGKIYFSLNDGDYLEPII